MTQEPIEAQFVEQPGTALGAHGGAAPVTELSKIEHGQIQAPSFNREQLDVLKNTLATDLSDTEFELFIHVSRRTGLDPFARQIFAIKRAGKMTIQTSIDGFRLQAQRSGKLRGTRGPWWCGADGVWRDVWLEKSPPEAAKVEVIHADYADPVTGVARWGAFAQTTQEGRLTSMWDRMGDHMLAKCAEALALRRAFPAELSGLYTDDEMGQAGNGAAALPPGPAQQQQASEPRPPVARAAAAPARPERPAVDRPAALAANAQQAQAAPEAGKPAWGPALKIEMDKRQITLEDVAAFLGSDATTGNINQWLSDDGGRTVIQLATDAASLAGKEAAIKSGEVNPDDKPF